MNILKPVRLHSATYFGSLYEMKIWIIASDPFYREFEKIAEIWAPENEIEITLISKYGYNLKSLWSFCSIYAKFRPDTVLTDHGYFGFLPIMSLNKLFRLNTKFSFYLRGNYWLEEKLRNEKDN